MVLMVWEARDRPPIRVYRVTICMVCAPVHTICYLPLLLRLREYYYILHTVYGNRRRECVWETIPLPQTPSPPLPFPPYVVRYESSVLRRYHVILLCCILHAVCGMLDGDQGESNFGLKQQCWRLSEIVMDMHEACWLRLKWLGFSIRCVCGYSISIHTGYRVVEKSPLLVQRVRVLKETTGEKNSQKKVSHMQKRQPYAGYIESQATVVIIAVSCSWISNK